MKSLRDIISDVIGELRANNIDDRYSYRFIASKLKGYIETFLKQDSVDRTILKINELWKPLLHIQLSDINDYPFNQYYAPSNKTLKKSIKKLPEVYTCKFGNLIKIVNIDGSIEYQPTKSFLYKDIQNRDIKNSKIRYYWIEDGYLYIPDADTEEVKGYGLFKDSQEADFFNETIDCCYKPLDSILLVPDYILSISKEQVIKDLVPEKQLPEDTNPNENSNLKT